MFALFSIDKFNLDSKKINLGCSGLPNCWLALLLLSLLPLILLLLPTTSRVNIKYPRKAKILKILETKKGEKVKTLNAGSRRRSSSSSCSSSSSSGNFDLTSTSTSSSSSRRRRIESILVYS